MVAVAYGVGAGLAKCTVFFYTGLDAFLTLVRVPLWASVSFSVELLSVVVVEGCWLVVSESNPGGILVDCGFTLGSIASTLVSCMIECGSVLTDFGSTLESASSTVVGFRDDCVSTRECGESTGGSDMFTLRSGVGTV